MSHFVTFFLFLVGNTKFVDELNVYLETFNLENNRKLVLDSGKKTWIFETLKHSMMKINSEWIGDSSIPIVLKPSVKISTSIKQLIDTREEMCFLTDFVERLNEKHELSFDIDISSRIEQEAIVINNIKERISGNLNLLQKINKNLDLSQENLEFWSSNIIKNYISNNRTVDGKTYREYEAFYLENIQLNS